MLQFFNLRSLLSGIVSDLYNSKHVPVMAIYGLKFKIRKG